MQIGSQRQKTNVLFAEIQERTNQVVTPQAIENRLVELSKEVDEAHSYLEKAEFDYHKAKADFEIKIAGIRLSFNGEKMRVQDVQDQALSLCATEYRALQTAEATAKAARANATRIRTQVDIARSVGTSVRASIEM